MSASTAAAAPLAAEIQPSDVPRIAAGFRLQWEPAQKAHVLLYPEGMVKLNQSAGEILVRCDGVRSVAAIVAALEQAFAAKGLMPDVCAFLALAASRQWIVWQPREAA